MLLRRSTGAAVSKATTSELVQTWMKTLYSSNSFSLLFPSQEVSLNIRQSKNNSASLSCSKSPAIQKSIAHLKRQLSLTLVFTAEEESKIAHG